MPNYAVSVTLQSRPEFDRVRNNCDATIISELPNGSGTRLVTLQVSEKDAEKFRVQLQEVGLTRS